MRTKSTKMLVDFHEAKACISEYCISLGKTCDIFQSNVRKGEFRERVDALNEIDLQTLTTEMTQARRLSILLLRQMNAQLEQLRYLSDDWIELAAELEQLQIAIDRAEKQRDEQEA